jgi:L-aspartate oxidase
VTRCDLLVLGSGIAGLTTALHAARYGEVLVVTKKDRAESNSNYAQGGIAAVFGADDSFALHREDTLRAGAGLCHPGVVDVLVREGPERVLELLALGARFTREGETLSLGREGGHSRRRVVRADDLTGREIERALLDAVAASPRIRVLEDHLAVDLALDAGGRCGGAWVLGPAGDVGVIAARAVVLATGGCGQVYQHTTNPAIATGDGVAMAYRAGAKVADMEFIQFHPTALYPARERSFLISEAVRGEGAVLRRRDGTAFMERYHALGSLAPRDVVARAIDREMKEHGDPYVLLDCSPIAPEELSGRFPNIVRETRSRGIDPLREPLPVVPAAHYLCGGVLTDTFGRTSIDGLYAVGETACTGVHGANRLASNSLLEALVFAHRTVERLGPELDSLPCESSVPSAPPSFGVLGAAPRVAAEMIERREEIRALMWEHAGIVRTSQGLAAAKRRLEEIAQEVEAAYVAAGPSFEAVEVRNLVTTALLIVRSARSRHESRGLHFTLDFPYRDNERFLRDTVLGAP